ncbi:hypothetical protein QAD02_017403 [Eretmocerus hayati]|uniref:Uncharacterized protein n=1 Tax=Eretmocerus hayati TaxID=131215 RepID=A0ACC2PFL2_9HYME|nr:hypothetical protein QAD02_017403 [Eretmocerus hayati]
MSEIFDPEGGCLRSTFTRKSYFNSNFDYKPPLPVPIYDSGGKEATFTYSYVNILKTITLMLKNKDIRQFCMKPNVTKDPRGFFDLKDGNVIHKNEFFLQEYTIHLGIFQDAFELCSPVGSHKKKNKMLGFYFTLLNLPPDLRSKLKNIKLIFLCKESYQRDYG